MIQDVMSVIAAFFGSLGFSIIYNIRGRGSGFRLSAAPFLGLVSGVSVFCG